MESQLRKRIIFDIDPYKNVDAFNTELCESIVKYTRRIIKQRNKDHCSLNQDNLNVLHRDEDRDVFVYKSWAALFDLFFLSMTPMESSYLSPDIVEYHKRRKSQKMLRVNMIGQKTQCHLRYVECEIR